MHNPQRPTAVKALVGLDVLLGVLILLALVASAIGQGFLPGTYSLFRGAVVSTVLAALDFILACGLWARSKWAWYGSFVFSAFGIIAAIFALFVRPRIGEFVSLAADLVIVYLLMQPGVQRYFLRFNSSGPTQAAGPSVM